MFNALEILMAGLALGVLVAGLARRWQLAAAKQGTLLHKNWAFLLGAVYGGKRILERPLVGLAHLGLVWGFTFFVVVVLIAQTPLRFPGLAAWSISFVLDMAGFCMVAATLFFLVRRLVRNRSQVDSRPPRQVVLPLILLLVILSSGFLAEAARLKLTGSQPVHAAPVGWLLSMFVPGTPLFMQVMIRVHVVAVILFIMAVPFTFMRHLGSTSVHLLRRPQPPAPMPSTLNLEKGPLGTGTLTDLSALQLREAEACVSCGRCDERCPALISGKPLSPRRVMGAIVDQMETCAGGRTADNGTVRLLDTISDDAVWACTTCMACVTVCPADVRPLEKILELRRHQTLAEGALPAAAAPMIRNLELFGDVNGKGTAHKADWALNRDVPEILTTGNAPDVLVWVGCSGAFHPTYQQTTRDLVSILRAAGVSFAILAGEEWCCGDPARKLGDEALFLKLARHNMARFQQYGVKKIVACCPHCFTTLGREYGALGCQVDVVPAVSMVAQLIAENRIQLKYPLAETLAIHDPCYLGRYHGITQPLRTVCRSVPGASLAAVPRSGENGFCCGGGGGRMWLHENLGENINVVRARELVDAEADSVVTACPYCLTMMEDGVKTVNEENPPRVVDVVTLVAEALG